MVLAHWPLDEVTFWRSRAVCLTHVQFTNIKVQKWTPNMKPIANPSLMARTDGSQDIVHLPTKRYRKPTYPFVADLRFKSKVHVSARDKT